MRWSSSRTIRSASLTVDRRCELMRFVCPRLTRRRCDKICASVCVSTEERASSRMRMRGRRMRARAMAVRCLCPRRAQPPLADGRFESAGQFADVVGQSGFQSGALDILRTRPRSAPGDVFRDR